MHVHVAVCVAVSYFFMAVPELVLTCPVISNQLPASWLCGCVCVCVCMHGKCRVQSTGRGQNRDRCENRLTDKNPRHNPPMSTQPSLCDSGHFTLWECVHVDACLPVCSVTQEAMGSSGDIRPHDVLNRER